MPRGPTSGSGPARVGPRSAALPAGSGPAGHRPLAGRAAGRRQPARPRTAIGMSRRPRATSPSVARPCLLVMRPANANGAAMIVAAGGGYEFIALGNEGVPVGRVLNAAGITVFLLVYRLPAEGWGSGSGRPPAGRAACPEADPVPRPGIRHRSLARRRPRLLGGRPPDGRDRGWQRPRPLHGVDAADAQPIRPGPAGLIYPVITMRKPFDRTHTRRILVGDEVTPDEMKTYSVDLQVGPETPPTFLVQAIDDPDRRGRSSAADVLGPAQGARPGRAAPVRARRPRLRSRRARNARRRPGPVCSWPGSACTASCGLDALSPRGPAGGAVWPPSAGWCGTGPAPPPRRPRSRSRGSTATRSRSARR